MLLRKGARMKDRTIWIAIEAFAALTATIVMVGTITVFAVWCVS